MGLVRESGYLKHDGNVVMLMIELLKHLLFVFMIFTPFVPQLFFVSLWGG